MSLIKNAQIRYRVIDRALRNEFNPYPSKSDLRESCEEAIYGDNSGDNICDSTIEKDMASMKMEHDAPIRYSKKNGGYYYTNPNFSLDEIPLTADDLEAIKFATNTLSQFKDVAMFRQFGFAIDKIVDRINISSDTHNDEADSFVQFEVAVNSGGSEFLSPLLHSIKESTAVYFDYESFQSQKKKARKVLPLLLKEYRNRWYLLSYDVAKEAIITYALDRITDFKSSEEKLRNPLKFDPAQFFRHAIGITASASLPENVIFKADNVAARYIHSQPFHSSQEIIKEGKNKTTFEMVVFVSEELIRGLLSYGGEVEVVEPESLRAELAKRIKTMAEVYNDAIVLIPKR